MPDVSPLSYIFGFHLDVVTAESVSHPSPAPRNDDLARRAGAAAGKTVMSIDALDIEGGKNLAHLGPVIQRQDKPTLQAAELLGHRDELTWARQALELVKEDTTDARSERLWRASVDHDCAAEYEMAGGGNSADMRRDVCLIVALYDRAEYLQRAGRR